MTATLLPTLGANEILLLSFDLDLPLSALPLSIRAQFAAGQGSSDGTPLFSGDHPTRYFGVDDPQLFFVPEARASGLALAAAAWLGRRRRRGMGKADAAGRLPSPRAPWSVPLTPASPR